MKKKYDIAAYVWPSYTGDEPRSRIFWPEGYGEWQTVKSAVKKTPDHDWPRKPLWGYVNEADPYVMEMQINAAVDHGVNVFIYDWYWYDNRPFLEQCLNNGFLGAKNNNKMKFMLMWANHDATATWDKRVAGTFGDAVVWEGKANRQQFETIAKRVTEKYFIKDNYYKIDGKPVFIIYEIDNFVNGLGGVQQAREALEWWREEVKKYGLPGVHLQLTCRGNHTLNLSGVDGGGSKIASRDFISAIGFDSTTHYQMIHFTPVKDKTFDELAEIVKAEWNKMEEYYSVPYYPHVSIGWDNNPRFNSFRPEITKGNTPEKIKQLLIDAKEYSDKHNKVPLITVNSWNEWTETSYLEPDDLYGYGYLNAIKEVFC